MPNTTKKQGKRANRPFTGSRPPTLANVLETVKAMKEEMTSIRHILSRAFPSEPHRPKPPSERKNKAKMAKSLRETEQITLDDSPPVNPLFNATCPFCKKTFKDLGDHLVKKQRHGLIQVTDDNKRIIRDLGLELCHCGRICRDAWAHHFGSQQPGRTPCHQYPAVEQPRTGNNSRSKLPEHTKRNQQQMDLEHPAQDPPPSQIVHSLPKENGLEKRQLSRPKMPVLNPFCLDFSSSDSEPEEVPKEILIKKYGLDKKTPEGRKKLLGSLYSKYFPEEDQVDKPDPKEDGQLEARKVIEATLEPPKTTYIKQNQLVPFVPPAKPSIEKKKDQPSIESEDRRPILRTSPRKTKKRKLHNQST